MTVPRAQRSQDEGRPLPGAAPDPSPALAGQDGQLPVLRSEAAGAWAVYVRRSQKDENDADVSDATQEAVARSRLPATARVVVYADSGGHNSGFSDARSNYQRLLADLRAGRLAGIAAFDDSRLNRNAENALSLYRECKARGIPILTGSTTADLLFSAAGGLSFGLQAVVSEHHRNQHAERMRAQARHTYDDGRHRGNPPFGYDDLRDDKGRIARPRQLLVVPEQAEVVRRVFRELASRPYSEVAAVLTREGIPAPSIGWNRAAVRDLYERRLLYRGFVVTKRGKEYRPGLHEPILSEQQVAEAVAGVEDRRSGNQSQSRAKRAYLLSGVLYCSCGARRQGAAKASRGRVWLYYVCPVSDRNRIGWDAAGNAITCGEPHVPAADAERHVLDALSEFLLPPNEIAAAREELRARLGEHRSGLAAERLNRLRLRLDRLADLFSWGDLSEADYQRKKADTEAEIACLLRDMPQQDQLGAFDAHAVIASSLPDAIGAATPGRLKELVRMVVERAETAGRQVVRVEWVPPARPFFRSELAQANDGSVLVVERPRRESNSRRRP